MADALKSRSYYALNNATGQGRSSIFAGFSSYQLFGRLCSETSAGRTNPFYDGHFVGGGPWDLNRDVTEYVVGQVRTNLVQGPVIAATPTTSWIGKPAAFSKPSDVNLNAAGTTGIARTEPTAPSFDLSVALGEITQEGLPNLPGKIFRDRVGKAKSAGKDYLNVEFGWAPLVRSVRDFAHTVDRSDKILAQYHKDAGHPIKRRYDWPDEMVTAQRFTNISVLPSYSSLGPISGYETFQSTKKQWFEGSYIYYLPTFRNDTLGKFQGYGRDARKLLGVDLTPETLWNLSPWTWAADWFGNVGDVMAATSAIGRDGLVLRYGHIMCHIRTESAIGGFNPNYGTVTARRVEETKTRRNATPYGFGVAFSSLSAKQVAIVAALGLSRW
jgi:hypothetical protein